MPLLIDGYNLLHVTGIVGRAGSGLQGSRDALLRCLASAIEPKELPETTVVFDAAEAPAGLPRIVTHEGMTVRYASDYDDADALIEELIAASHVPRSLMVVSSDHRLQRAAKRRRAPFVDSDIWFAEVMRRRHESRPNRGHATLPSRSRSATLTAEETAYWLKEFAEAPTDSEGGAADGADRQTAEFDDPFPPGYGEDLLSK